MISDKNGEIAGKISQPDMLRLFEPKRKHIEGSGLRTKMTLKARSPCYKCSPGTRMEH
jgi:hypothetical protein